VPTAFSHAAVPLVLGVGLGRDAVPRRLLVAGVLVSALPDLDVVARQWGVPYSAGLGHRGVAILWPWSEHRFFTPGTLRVVEVSPIRLTPLLSARGAAVLESELRWIWLPALALGLILVGARCARSRRRHGGHA